MIYFLQQALNALQLGSIYALIALGYTMVYGILTMINFAHGDFFMVGAFICFVVVTFLQLPFLPALILSMAGVTILGVIVERIAYKPLRQAPRVSAIITALGVGIFLENFTLALNPYPKHIPALIANLNWTFGGLTISSLQCTIVVLSVVLMIVLHLIVKYTKVGMAMRAISWDKNVVPLMGVPVNTVISITFAIGSGLGGAAGMMYGMAYPVIDPYMGIMVGWKAFISAVVGGIGNIRGAMVGGYILGATEIMVAAFFPSTYRDFVAFSLLIVLLIFRPYGIFGKPRIQKV
ncbi:MAG: branched-chain amino acid ABC transporter permease [Syntrophus sp. (in: bacteria)]|nr:branched-chain amino acid ABC transporter permease [Syntrophus sp. (in: bacteria)]